MKKLLFVLVIMALAIPVFAQYNSGDTGDMYYINVPVEKVYLAYEGYLIQYRNGANTVGTVGIPYEWFTDSASRAELMRTAPGKDWPSMSVFYRDGEFSHVRLYVHRSRAHVTWSVVPMGADVSGHFGAPESFRLEFK